MSRYVFDPPAVATVPVEGRAERFPVRRILCVGRNYAAHRREMGGDDREPPFFFAKPADAVAPPGQDPAYPPKTANLHHEIGQRALGGSSFGHGVPVTTLTPGTGRAVSPGPSRRPR